MFGDLFANENNQNCFLLINDKLLDLNKFISLSDIFDDNNISNDFLIKLNVKLIERKFKLMNNLSFMFSNISTLSHESNFENFNSKNIKNMSHMSYKCFK